jgi:hypothetical protein
VQHAAFVKPGRLHHPSGSPHVTDSTAAPLRAAGHRTKCTHPAPTLLSPSHLGLSAHPRDLRCCAWQRPRAACRLADRRARAKAPHHAFSPLSGNATSHIHHLTGVNCAPTAPMRMHALHTHGTTIITHGRYLCHRHSAALYPLPGLCQSPARHRPHTPASRPARVLGL